MDPRLQEMLDHHEIRNLLAEYCHGCDRGDAQRMGSVYSEDSWDDHGPTKCEGKEFSRRMTKEIVETTQLCSHQLGQSLIRVNGDTAGAETYFIATVQYRGKPQLNQLGGRYVDKLVREDGAWRIKQRICLREWSITHDITADWLAGQVFVGPSFSQEDPSYEALGIKHSSFTRLSA